MGVLATTSNISENILNGENDSIYQVGDLAHTSNKSKIPDYARDYRNEYLFIRCIDTCFKYYLENWKSGTLDLRVAKINKYLDIYEKKVNKPITVRYSHVLYYNKFKKKCKILNIYLKEMLI